MRGKKLSLVNLFLKMEVNDRLFLHGITRYYSLRVDGLQFVTNDKVSKNSIKAGFAHPSFIIIISMKLAAQSYISFY